MRAFNDRGEQAFCPCGCGRSTHWGPYGRPIYFKGHMRVALRVPVSNASGVYQIKNVVTGEVYIGASTRIDERWAAHVSKLLSGRCDSRSLQVAWNCYGRDAFEFSVLEDVAWNDRAGMLAAEQRWHDDMAARGVSLYSTRAPHGAQKKPRGRYVIEDMRELMEEQR
jgi:hypothetical protein